MLSKRDKYRTDIIDGFVALRDYNYQHALQVFVVVFLR
jgi:hypothetical protein